jgi:DNA-binding FadR family transcriptional regulator
MVSALMPVERTTLTREVAERLRQAILAGELVGGNGRPAECEPRPGARSPC